MSVVHGGDTAAAFRVELASGRLLFAKTHAAPPAGFFTTEATGLAWLRDSGAVRVPEVLAVSDGSDDEPAFLALEWIEQGRREPSRTSSSSGGDLARSTMPGAPSFGREDRRTTGSLGLPNDPCDTWSEFVGQRRFLPLARIARDRRSLPLDVIDRLETLATTLDRFDDRRPPARLHGDLWAGNRVVDDDGVELADRPRRARRPPRVRPGDDATVRRLRMRDVFDGYESVHPLADGWRDRVDLHQIAPLVVHAIKFGGHYVPAATAAIDRYV